MGRKGKHVEASILDVPLGGGVSRPTHGERIPAADPAPISDVNAVLRRGGAGSQSLTPEAPSSPNRASNHPIRHHRVTDFFSLSSVLVL